MWRRGRAGWTGRSVSVAAAAATRRCRRCLRLAAAAPPARLALSAGWADLALRRPALGAAPGPSAAAVSLSPERQQMELRFKEALPLGNNTLWIKFKYELREGLSGFYRWAAPVSVQCGPPCVEKACACMRSAAGNGRHAAGQPAKAFRAGS